MQCFGRSTRANRESDGVLSSKPFNPVTFLFLCSSKTWLWLMVSIFLPLQENQAPKIGVAAVDAPGRAMAAEAPSAELLPSGTLLSSLAVVAAPCRLAKGVGVPLRTLRRTLSWTCHQVAHNPLGSPFLCTYCIYLFCCFTINVLLNLL